MAKDIELPPPSTSSPALCLSPPSPPPSPPHSPSCSGRFPPCCGFRGSAYQSSTPQVGKHMCGIFNSEQEFIELVASFVIEGMKNNEMTVYVWHAHSPTELREIFSPAFEKEGLNYDWCLQQDIFRLVSADAIYFPHGAKTFSAENTIGQLVELYDQSVASGHFSGLRLTGEMSWALASGGFCSPEKMNDQTQIGKQAGSGESGADGGGGGGGGGEGRSYSHLHSHPHLKSVEKLIEYESVLGTFFDEKKCVGMCQYDTRLFPSSLLLSVLDTHPVAKIKGEEFENFYFMPPEDFLVEDLPTSVLNHRIKNLKYRKRVEERLQERTEQLLRANENIRQEVQERERLSLEKEAAEKLSKAKSDFMAVMSHEPPGTPLHGIISGSKFISDTELTCDQSEFIEMIRVSSDHLMTVLNDVLDWSKIESNNLLLEQKGFSLEKCIRGAVLMFKGKEKEISINYEVSRDVPRRVVGDVTRLRQI